MTVGPFGKGVDECLYLPMKLASIIISILSNEDCLNSILASLTDCITTDKLFKLRASILLPRVEAIERIQRN